MSDVAAARNAIIEALDKVSSLPRHPLFKDAEILLGDARRKIEAANREIE